MRVAKRAAMSVAVTVALAFAFALSTAVGAAPPPPNFSGNWTADLKASSFGPIGSPDHLTMQVTHKDPEISIHYDLGMAGTPVIYEATCKIDGKECKATKGEVTLSLQWQGDTLILNRAMSYGGMAIKLKESWTLSADGKTLTSSRDVSTDQGAASQKVVFTKS